MLILLCSNVSFLPLFCQFPEFSITLCQFPEFSITLNCGVEEKQLLQLQNASVIKKVMSCKLRWLYSYVKIDLVLARKTKGWVTYYAYTFFLYTSSPLVRDNLFLYRVVSFFHIILGKYSADGTV